MKFVHSLLLIIFLSPLAFAQRETDASHSAFTGTWKYVSSTTMGKPDQPYWTITQDGVEFKIVQKDPAKEKDRPTEFAYFTDGRGETNGKGQQKVTSTAEWDGNTLKILEVREVGVGAAKQKLMTIEKFEVSADGNTLTQSMFVDPRNVSILISAPTRQRIFTREK